jgi:heme/copper-type cytochrome/quinol oxidase subunit 3
MDIQPLQIFAIMEIYAEDFRLFLKSCDVLSLNSEQNRYITESLKVGSRLLNIDTSGWIHLMKIAMVMPTKEHVDNTCIILFSHISVIWASHMVKWNDEVAALVLENLTVLFELYVVVEVLEFAAVDLRHQLVQPSFLCYADKAYLESLML